jgi:hypothetical protein
MIVGKSPRLLTTLAGLRKEPPLVRRSAVPSQPASAIVLPGADGLQQIIGDSKPPIWRAAWIDDLQRNDRDEGAPQKTDIERLEEISPNGEFPNPEVIQSHLPFFLHRLTRPREGDPWDILPLDWKVEGSHFPLFFLLGVIPAAPEKVWRIIETPDIWSECMPYVLESRTTPAEGDDRKFLELKLEFFKILTRLLSLHYKVEIQNRVLGNARQSLFRLVEGKLDDRVLTLGLRKADGSWTVGPVGGHEELSYVAYQIHLDIDLPEGFLTAWTIEVILDVMYTKATEQFPSLFNSLERRSFDSSWKLSKGEKPSPGRYRMAPGFLRRNF